MKVITQMPWGGICSCYKVKEKPLEDLYTPDTQSYSKV